MLDNQRHIESASPSPLASMFYPPAAKQYLLHVFPFLTPSFVTAAGGGRGGGRGRAASAATPAAKKRDASASSKSPKRTKSTTTKQRTPPTRQSPRTLVAQQRQRLGNPRHILPPIVECGSPQSPDLLAETQLPPSAIALTGINAPSQLTDCGDFQDQEEEEITFEVGGGFSPANHSTSSASVGDGQDGSVEQPANSIAAATAASSHEYNFTTCIMLRLRASIHLPKGCVISFKVTSSLQ